MSGSRLLGTAHLDLSEKFQLPLAGHGHGSGWPNNPSDVKLSTNTPPAADAARLAISVPFPPYSTGSHFTLRGCPVACACQGSNLACMRAPEGSQTIGLNSPQRFQAYTTLEDHDKGADLVLCISLRFTKAAGRCFAMHDFSDLLAGPEERLHDFEMHTVPHYRIKSTLHRGGLAQIPLMLFAPHGVRSLASNYCPNYCRGVTLDRHLVGRLDPAALQKSQHLASLQSSIVVRIALYLT